MNKERISVGKTSVITSLKFEPCLHLQRLKRAKKTVSQDSVCPSEDSIREPHA
jgi:hypothetical protein